MLTLARCKRAMTVPECMRYGDGRQDKAVPLQLAHSPPVITCFRRFLGAHGSERATAAGEASRYAQAEAAPRAGAPCRQPEAEAPGRGMQRGGRRRGWGRRWGLDQHVMGSCVGLSLRDLQEMMALTLGEVISLAACNRIVSNVTAQVEACKSQPMEHPPPVVLVDGMWVTIAYPRGEITADAQG